MASLTKRSHGLTVRCALVCMRVSAGHGRHLPRGRKSQENLSISFEPPNIPASVFDAHDLDIDNLLQVQGYFY